MEKAMSVEDRIRRAEEIYYRRKNQEIPIREENTNIKPKRNIKLIKKMINQMASCLIIYGIFYTIINNNYVFSEDFTNKTKEILSQDINFSYLYSIIKNLIIPSEEIMQNEQIKNDEEQIKEEIQNNDENIGGAEELPITEDVALESVEIVEKKELSQMDQDANYIKSTINFIKPVNGTISSMFGLRNPTTAGVPKNHTGTDIAAGTGTKIFSSTDGKVIYAGNKGDFGKHIKIQVNDVIILYAHCNKLYVKEGDAIRQGQEIAEVGSTGNTTGPHLHFEVKYQDRYVNPQLILDL